MSTYAFETITPEQALSIQAGDYLTIAGGPASHASVVYSAQGLIELTLGARTVTFGADLSPLSLRGALEFRDGSRLLIGDENHQGLGGSDRGDGLYGGAGDDRILGGGGDDLLQGNSGNDRLYGGLGSNTVYGGQGDDTLFAADDAEMRGSFAQGNLGNDEIFGGGGNDTLLGGKGDDFIAGAAGDDYLSGDLGDDELHGGQGGDTLLGGAGNDTIQTGGGADRVLGGDGDDLIIIERSGAIAQGEAGNDTIVATSAGKDILAGGEGFDVFEFVATTPPNDGQDDVIVDWRSEHQLRFAPISAYSILPRQYSEFVSSDYASALSTANSHISGAGAVWVAAQVGSDVIVFADTDGDPSNGADVAVALVGRTLADISLANFI